MKAHGVNSGMSEEIKAVSTMVQPDFGVQQQVVKQEQSGLGQRQCEQLTSPSPTVHPTLNFEDLMEEGGPVVSDPMLSSHQLKMDEEIMDLAL